MRSLDNFGGHGDTFGKQLGTFTFLLTFRLLLRLLRLLLLQGWLRRGSVDEFIA